MHFSEEHPFYHVVDNHIKHANAECAECRLEQIVRQRTRGFHLLNLDGNGLRLRPTDHDGQFAVAFHLAQHHGVSS